MADKARMQIRWLSPGKLTPYEQNPRVTKPEAIDKVAASIEEFGWQQPIVVDEQMVIIAGHTRWHAALKLEHQHVPVLVATDLSPGQVRALRIADNRVAEYTTWDQARLEAEVVELAGFDNFDLSSLGFDDEEMQRWRDTWLRGGDSSNEDDLPPPEALEGPVVSRPGDVWLLAGHRLMCGDSTKPEDVERLLIKPPHLMVTDPPYGVEYRPEWRNEAKRGRGGTVLGAKATGEVSNDHPAPVGVAPARATGQVQNDDIVDWGAAIRLFPGDVAYMWCASWFVGEVERVLQDEGFDIRALIIWAKQHFAISRGHYHWQHENLWYAVRKGGKAHWNGSRKETTLWQVANRSAFGGEHDDADTNHGTQKPVEVMRRPIINNSKQGQAVYDPFIGSGTTIIAAESCGRICYAMDIDPTYVDLAVQRWQMYTEDRAVLEGTGQEYAEVMAQRLKAA